jgi:hypothetical protein
MRRGGLARRALGMQVSPRGHRIDLGGVKGPLRMIDQRLARASTTGLFFSIIAKAS